MSHSLWDDNGIRLGNEGDENDATAYLHFRHIAWRRGLEDCEADKDFIDVE
jgi:hypothetical protein